ncbi:MAG: hypothetical protein JNL98_22200 [Bryobacterales bacterium]|nr:hypothetical protein [Bryobacterales bacterium]
MRRWRDWWMLGAAGLTLLALTHACSRTSSKGVALDSSIEKLIPGDTVVLAGARVTEVEASPIYKRIMGDRVFPELEEFAKQTGLDPRRDLKEIVFASNGTSALMIARMTVADIPKLESVIEKRGARRMQAGSHTMFGSEEGAVSFVSNSIAIAGKTENLRDLLSGKQVDDLKKRNVLAKVASLPQDKHIWVVAVGGFAPMPLPAEGNLANLNRIFQSLDTTLLTLDLRDGVSLAAQGFCTNDAGAKQLHNTLRGLIGFGRLSTSADNPEILKFYDSIKVEQDKTEVKVNADVPMDMVDRFLKLTEKKKPAA